MKLWRMVLCIACTMILSGLTIAQETKPSIALKQRIKTFKNSGRYSVKYDKFKDYTSVSVGPFAIQSVGRHRTVLAVYADFSFEGQTVRQDVPAINLIFLSYSAFRGQGWTFGNHEKLYGIIDGERIELGEGDWNPQISKISSEQIIFRLPISTFLKIAEAKVVELKVGSVELKLKDEHFVAFRDLLSLTKQE